MECNQNDIVHLAVSYLEDTAVCLSVANLGDAMKQSIGRVIHYIVPMLSKSDKMIRASLESKDYNISMTLTMFYRNYMDTIFNCEKRNDKLMKQSKDKLRSKYFPTMIGVAVNEFE
ncbi:hypothetical protein H5410_038630 [Solanum commersonii]|uniref:Uncharacterized protein n=1 Tax=Solanum commersonii TaxID=4109 RepID=A0A9J5YEH0_SOLCO|nr:hypothetical protein H5410_038630 [Solanum commersonii]